LEPHVAGFVIDKVAVALEPTLLARTEVLGRRTTAGEEAQRNEQVHVDPDDFGPGEEGWLERNRNFVDNESGYMRLQCTKPQTIAHALNDSPAGLASWIVEKRRTWSDCGGDVEKRFSKDDLCTTCTLYWITESYGTSARYYYEAAHNLWKPSHEGKPVVEAPTAAAVFLKEVMLMPRKWAERYYNLKRWTVMPSGGHFAPMEEPKLLVDDLRAFFRTLR